MSGRRGVADVQRAGTIGGSGVTGMRVRRVQWNRKDKGFVKGTLSHSMGW